MMFSSSNLLTITTQKLNVKVPMIYAEDINSYELYLRQWLEVNSQLLNDWLILSETITSICTARVDAGNVSAPDLTVERAKCGADMQRKVNEIVSFTQRYEQLLDQVNANLLTLQEYRLFPFQLYDWIHGIDQYTAELTAIFNNTFGYVGMWMMKNATRYASYVDAIILFMNIIKTYQVLIDFSVNRSAKCGTCTNDSYDQYMCKLSFLCKNVQLPIIQIPSFKLPDIIFDLSAVNLNLTVLLPIFALQPVKIELPDIPNLPRPPAFTFDADFLKLFPELHLPTIPELPSPPSLPDLPSFLPNVELALPVLPPAPALPKIPDQLETALNFMDTLGSIYCWIKNGLGFVAESAVKSKIEQLTQRTYHVGYIDDMLNLLNVRAEPPTLQGFDLEVDVKTNIDFNFDQIYNFLDAVTQDINNWSTRTMYSVNSTLKEVEKKGKKKADHWEKDLLSLSQTPQHIAYTSYPQAKQRFDESLVHFKEKTLRHPDFQQRLLKIQEEVDHATEVIPNQSGLAQQQAEVLDLLASAQIPLKEQTRDFADARSGDVRAAYESLFSHLVKTPAPVLTTPSELAFNLPLFSLSSGVQQQLQSYGHPYQLLLDNKAQIVSGFMGALQTASAEQL